MTINERVFALIDERNVTQKVLCNATGIPVATMSAWKTRKTEPPAKDLYAIADYFKVSIEYLILGKEKNVDALSSDEHDVVVNYRKLDVRGKHKIHTTIYEELDRMAAASAQEQRELNEIFKLASSPNVPVNTENATTNLNALFGQTTKKG